MSIMTKKIKKITKLFAYIENKQYLCSVKRVKNDILLQKKQGICFVKSWFLHNLYSRDCMPKSEKTEFLFKMPGVRLQLVNLDNSTCFQIRKNRRVLTKVYSLENAVRFFKGQVFQLCMQTSFLFEDNEPNWAKVNPVTKESFYLHFLNNDFVGDIDAKGNFTISSPSDEELFHNLVKKYHRL